MTGGAFFPTSGEEYDLDGTHSGGHAVQWVGKPGVKGPRWARLPLLTVGMLGIQCVWSIEMGYASPYLLDLGLSKSWMSLVFMAGPLSGLIVQPLIGVFADRSKSRWGRRRPFMLAGCFICAFAMMLLGWSREASSLFSGGSRLAIAFAVWSIYLIDFSINAVMSTDRALVVDTLPPSQQEEGSAWAGRMFGFGSVVGFFVGNLDLVPYLGFLGTTQIQILSFITSAVLLLSHTFTSWAVKERVLLRDDRPQSQSGLLANLKAIWDNMFSLSPGIQTICVIQFFAFLGWFPILFFTTVWVSEIYKTSVDQGTLDDAAFEADAVRSGARALFFQAIINIITSIGLPFLIGESGVQSSHTNGYEALNGNGNGVGGAGSHAELPSATWKRKQQDWEGLSRSRKALMWAKNLISTIREEGLTLPIRGLTLVDVWCWSMFLFAACMLATWFVSTVYGAYVVVSVTGICWALSQWAPYSLLGELILIDGTERIPLESGPRDSDEISLHDIHRSPSPLPPPVLSATSSTAQNSALHSRHASRTSLDQLRVGDPAALSSSSRPSSRPASRLSLRDRDRETIPGLGLRVGAGLDASSSQPSRDRSPAPAVLQLNLGKTLDDGLEEGETSLVLHHADESDDEIPRSPMRSPVSPRTSTSQHDGGHGTADKAGVILGIHNVFLVLPQFVVTFLASIIFYLMEPDKGLPAKHPQAPPVGNTTIASISEGMAEATGVVLRDLIRREGGLGGEASSPDAVGLIFRIGGVSAAIGGVVCYRLSRRWARGEGI